MMQLLVALIFFVFSPITFSINNYKVESIAALTETAVAEAVRNSLDSKGLRVVDENGKAVCEIWLRKDLPTTKDEIAGASFSQIGEGALVGVINFPANASDYRGQPIKAGFYTLRYGLILQDGNHLGVSPARDFLLACPVADDKDPNARLTFDEMMKLSRAAAGAGHPSTWCIVQPTAGDGLPRAVINEHEHVVLEVKLPAKGGEIAIGLVVVGKTEG